MKWKGAIAAVLALAVAAPAVAEAFGDWTIAYTGKDGAWAYRPDLLAPSQLYIAIRFPQAQRLGDGGSYSGTVTSYQLDCAGKRAKVMGVAHFEDDGSLIDDDHDGGDWAAFKPSGGNFDFGAVMAGQCNGHPLTSPAVMHADRVGLQQFLGSAVKSAQKGS